MDNITLHIEALIFSSENSIRAEEIAYCIQAVFEHDCTAEEVIRHVKILQAKYAESNSAIELVKLNNGYQFLTKSNYHSTISILQAQRAKKKLSQAAMETLAIIAYKQPVTKTDIEQIRGVNCDYSIQKLLEKDLISIVGKADTIGKPILYATSNMFMDYFGINSTDELPHLKELTGTAESIGEKTE